MSAEKTATGQTSDAATASQNQPAASPRKTGLLKKVLLTLGVVVVLFLGFVAAQPSEYRITRSATIAAPPAEVFPQVDNLHNWEAWSPWAKLDPAAKNSFEGPPEGTGSIFKWSGNDQIGEGQMTIIESRPDELVRFKLEFVRPFEDTSTSEFTFQPKGDQTVVTWSMSGRKNFVNKAVCLFMNMDKMLGGDFEKGLAQMKAVVEQPAEK
jgi:uncharacterized protein YndB with AHSA1/START domain